MASSYIIMINEEQREVLLKVLKGEPLPDGFNENDEHPLAYWLDMLRDLQKDEKEHPGVIHGFCL